MMTPGDLLADILQAGEFPVLVHRFAGAHQHAFRAR